MKLEAIAELFGAKLPKSHTLDEIAEIFGVPVARKSAFTTDGQWVDSGDEWGQRFCVKCGCWEIPDEAHACDHPWHRVSDLDVLRPFSAKQQKEFAALYAMQEKRHNKRA